MTQEEKAILDAFTQIERERAIWSQNNLERKLREMNSITGLTDRDKRRRMVKSMASRHFPIRDFDTHSGLDPEPYKGEPLF